MAYIGVKRFLYQTVSVCFRVSIFQYVAYRVLRTPETSYQFYITINLKVKCGNIFMISKFNLSPLQIFIHMCCIKFVLNSLFKYAPL